MACVSGDEGQRAFCRGRGKDGWDSGQIDSARVSTVRGKLAEDIEQ